MQKPQAPVLNGNGTSADSLVDQHIIAVRRVRAAMEALAEVTPHGRDYQTAPEGAYELARKEHEARMAALRGVAEQLSDIVHQIQDQIDERAKNRMR